MVLPRLSKERLVVNTWFVQCNDHHHGQLVVVLPVKGISLVVNTWFVQCRDHHHGQLVVVLPRLSKELA